MIEEESPEESLQEKLKRTLGLRKDESLEEYLKENFALEEGEDIDEFIEEASNLSMQCFIQALEEGKLQEGEGFVYPKILEDM
jgi:hypothetical protein